MPEKFPPLWFADHKNIDAPPFKNFKASDKTIFIPVRLCLLPTAAPRPAALQGKLTTFFEAENMSGMRQKGAVNFPKAVI